MQSLFQPFLDVLLLTGMVALQSVSAHYFPNAGALLNLPLIVLLYMTLTQASLGWILFLGTLAGLLQDSQAVNLLGLNGFCNLSVCILVYLGSMRIAVDGWIMRTSILGLSYAAAGLISWSLRVAFLDRYEHLLFDQLLMGALVCAGLGLPIFSLFDRFLTERTY
jgi:rod shape-determining protein MreD